MGRLASLWHAIPDGKSPPRAGRHVRLASLMCKPSNFDPFNDASPISPFASRRSCSWNQRSESDSNVRNRSFSPLLPPGMTFITSIALCALRALVVPKCLRILAVLLCVLSAPEEIVWIKYRSRYLSHFHYRKHGSDPMPTHTRPPPMTFRGSKNISKQSLFSSCSRAWTPTLQ